MDDQRRRPRGGATERSRVGDGLCRAMTAALTAAGHRERRPHHRTITPRAPPPKEDRVTEEEESRGAEEVMGGTEEAMGREITEW